MSTPDHRTIPTLTGDNYPRWKRLINAHFMAIDATEIVLGTKSRPDAAPADAPNTDRADYDKARRLASSAIQSTIDETNASHVVGCETDPAMQWTKLDAVHNKKSAGTRFNAMNALFSIHQEEGETLMALYARAQAAMQLVKALRPTHTVGTGTFTLDTLDNELLTMVLLRGLRDEHDIIRSTLLIHEELTLTILKTAFQNKDNQEQKSASPAIPALKAFTPSSHSNPSHRSTTSSTSTQRFGRLANTPGAICSYCGKPNHTEAQCFTKKNKMEKTHARFAQFLEYEAANSTSTTESHSSPTFASNASTLSIPREALSNLNADTGASRIMMGNEKFFSSLRPLVRTIRLANGGHIQSKGEGEVAFQPWINGKYSSEPIIFPNVLFAPDLQSNLIAVLSMVRRQGYEVHISDRGMEFSQKGIIKMMARIDDNCVAYLNGRVVTTENAHAVSTCPLNRELWHRRLGHFHFEGLESLIRENLVNDLRIDNTSKPDPICIACISGKQHRAPHTTPATRSDTLLNRVAADLHGPIHTEALPHRAKYWMPIVDEASAYVHLALLRSKDQALEAFERFKAMAETQTGRKIKHLRDDKGGEFMSTAFDKMCDAAGIVREHTIRDTPQQNGLVERVNRRISEGATTLLNEASLPPSFWGFAVLSFVHVMNLCGSKTRPGMTPHERWHGKKPSVKRLRVFGCRAYVHVQNSQRKALESHTRKCVFVGYPSNRPGWMFWDPSSRKLIYSDSAVFDERNFPGTAMTHEDIPNLLPDWDQPEVNVENEEHIPEFPIIPHMDPNPAPNPPILVAGRPVHPLLPVPREAPGHAPAPVPGPVPAPNPAPEIRLPRELQQLRVHFETFPEDLPAVRGSNARQPGIHNRDWNEEDDDHAHLGEALVDPVINPFIPSPTHNVQSSENAKSQWKLPTQKPTAIPIRPEFICIPLVDGVEFALNTSSTNPEPATLAEALRRPDGDKYLESAIEEVRAHLENGTWKVVRLPRGKRAIGSRWVFKIKRTADGSIERYKGRIVAKGYAQREGIDYTETFAPTARFGALRTVIALAAIEDMELESIDISTAFLNGEIDAEVFMQKPEGIETPGFEGPEWVLQLLKGLYGIKQGPRLWSQKLHTVLSEIGFHRLESDHSVFVYERDGVKVVVPVHVDDLVLASTSLEAVQMVKRELRARFKIRDQGPTTFILGVQLERNRKERTIKLSQPTYIQSILDDFDMEGCNPARTPMDEKARLSKTMSPSTDAEKEEMRDIPYREAVGKLLYLSIATRPDISYAVGVLCRYNDNPGMEHWLAVKRVLRYLQGTKEYTLTYAPSTATDEIFVTHSDADLGGNPDNARSTAGFVMSVGGGAVLWGSRLQRHVSLSSTESEYTTAAATGCEIIWMRGFLDEIGYDTTKPSTLFLDSNSALQVAKNPEHQSTMKHVNRNYHWIRERVAEGDIKLVHVPGTENVADIFTKPLGFMKFDKFRTMLGLSAPINVQKNVYKSYTPSAGIARPTR